MTSNIRIVEHHIPSLYRVRKDQNVSRESVSSFSYIPDPAAIMRQRFNKEGTQVLYTATTPVVAVQETLTDPCCFYLSRWKNRKSFNSFIALDDNCSEKPDSNARLARRALEQIECPDELRHIDELRKILEKDYSRCNENEKYIESSELAGKILEVADCILSYSKHNAEELNITFRKEAADLLELDAVYYCGPQQDPKSPLYDVKEIGVIRDGQIEWHNWEIDESSVEIINQSRNNGFIQNQYSIQGLLKRKNALLISVNQDIEDTHLGLLKTKEGDFGIAFGIRLLPIH